MQKIAQNLYLSLKCSQNRMLCFGNCCKGKIKVKVVKHYIKCNVGPIFHTWIYKCKE